MNRSHLGLAVAAVTAVVATTASASVAAPESQGAATSARGASAAASKPGSWRLVSSETFDSLTAVAKAPWVRDPGGDASPWNVDHLDEDGQFFDIQGGSDFRDQLAAADVMRKRVALGTKGWLTAELAARDADRDGVPESPPSLRTVTVGGQAAGRLDEPSHDGGIIIRNTQPLPPQYRVEYTLRTLDFGGKRGGSWSSGGKINGYGTSGCKTNWPWKRSGAFDGSTDQCNSNFTDVRFENGFSFLTITDYAKPAPHNNVFLLSHRKVGLDTYNVNATWASQYAVCNPADGSLLDYQDSSTNAINSIFFDGSRFRSPEIAYQQPVMPTACGVFDGSDPNAAIVSAAELQPELMPGQTYRFAVERSSTGYTTEMSGPFRHIGQATLRYYRAFVQDGVPIWHYNQTAAEYDGRFDSTLTFGGPGGPSYTKQQWPAGSAYPDYFVIGDHHLNSFEGSATIDDLKLYVPK